FGQTDSTTNGIRVVQASGSPVRADDANSADELLGATVYVNEGTNAGRTYTCSAPGPIDLGTTPLPFTLSGDVSTIVTKTVTGAGLATGGGPISGDPIITVGKATTKTVLDKSVDTQAVTPKAVDAKLESQFGEVFTDERYAKVLWADASGVPIALEHEGTVWARPSSLITDEYWEAAIIDANGVVIMGKPYDSAFMMGPFYDSTAKIDNAAAYVDGSGNAVALTDRVIQLTFGEVVPVAVQIQGTNAVYKMVTGSTVTSVAEDLLANTTLTTGFTKVIYEVYYGQSLSTGGATGAAVTTSAFLPGRVVMPNGGIRPLGTSQDGNYATTPLPRDNIKSWVDAFERTEGNA
ncbi:hypothetical protein Q5692_40305, partial [Microcoleus sp. C2C3]|uniref:hypothetical protein n=1 Tax=Microcoleus sp. C2C3 TaxID=3055324 RepID=UPI002FCF65BA